MCFAAKMSSLTLFFVVYGVLNQGSQNKFRARTLLKKDILSFVGKSRGTAQQQSLFGSNSDILMLQ